MKLNELIRHIFNGFNFTSLLIFFCLTFSLPFIFIINYNLGGIIMSILSIYGFFVLLYFALQDQKENKRLKEELEYLQKLNRHLKLDLNFYTKKSLWGSMD